VVEYGGYVNIAAATGGLCTGRNVGILSFADLAELGTIRPTTRPRLANSTSSPPESHAATWGKL
jgi:hypothetical protein